MRERLLGLNIFHRIRIAARRQPPSSVDTGPDYTQRWPTVTTLVEQRSDSRFFYDSEQDEEEERDDREEDQLSKPVTVKALAAAATSLGWLNMKLESMQDYLDHKILLSEARVQKRSSRLSNRTNSEQPGQSTHPYDTGIQKAISEAEEESSRRNSRVSSPTSNKNCLGSDSGTKDVHSATINTPIQQIWKKIRFCRHAEWEPLSQTQAISITKNKGISITVQANNSKTKHDLEASVRTPNSAEPKTKANRLWWNPFSFSDRRTKHEQIATHSPVSPEIQLDETDLAIIPDSPLSKWKRTRDRRGSAYPGKEFPDREFQKTKGQYSDTQQSVCIKNGAFGSLSPRKPVKNPPKVNTPCFPTAQPSKVKLCSPKTVLSPQPSGNPVLSAPFGMQRRPSSANCIGETCLSSSKSITPTSGDMPTNSPRAGAIRYLLGLVKDSPPSRAISPLDLAENDLPNSDAYPPARNTRRNTDTTTSSETKPTIEEVSHGQGKGSRVGMAVKFRNITKEHSYREPVNQSSRLGMISSPKYGKTNSRRANTTGNEVRGSKKQEKKTAPDTKA